MKIMKRIYLMKRIVLSLLIVLGVFTGATAQKANMDARKLQLALFAISNLYVDSTSETKLVEDAIVGMLDKLDPHSNYMDPEETKEMSWRSFLRTGLCRPVKNQSCLLFTISFAVCRVAPAFSSRKFFPSKRIGAHRSRIRS